MNPICFHTLYFQMKVIKQLKKDTPEDKLKRFFKQMPIITKAILILYSFIGIVLLIAPVEGFSIWTLFAMRFGELVLLSLTGISDLKREEGKGSFYIIISFITKNLILLLILFLLKLALQNWPIFDILTNTSIIIQYLFLIMIEDGLKDPDGIKYLFIEPFQLKSKFYPIFYFVLLTIGGVRVDLLVPIVLGLILHFTKCNNLLTRMSEFLDSKLLNERMVNAGFLKTGSELRDIKTMDELVTSDSVILQEK